MQTEQQITEQLNNLLKTQSALLEQVILKEKTQALQDFINIDSVYINYQLLFEINLNIQMNQEQFIEYTGGRDVRYKDKGRIQSMKFACFNSDVLFQFDTWHQLNLFDNDTALSRLSVNEIVKFNSNNIKRFKKLHIKNGQLFLQFYMNKNQLSLQLGKNFVNHTIEFYNYYKLQEESQKIKQYVCNYTNPSNFSPSQHVIELFNYQKQDVLWMERQEKGQVIRQLQANCAFIGPDTSVDLQKYKVSQPDYSNPKIVHGGILINEMGLGKTIDCLELIARNRKINNLVIDNDSGCHYLYKRGKNTGKYCQKNISQGFFCKTHQKTAFVNKLQTKQISQTQNQDLPETSSATLVLCPTQICENWCNEYYSKYSETGLKVIFISGIDVYNTVSYKELLLSDIVIAPYSFLKNKMYLENQSKKQLHKIFWQRIIFDEFHEITLQGPTHRLKQSSLSFYINDTISFYKNLKSNSKWIITGTPFPSQYSFSYYLKVLVNDTFQIKNSTTKTTNVQVSTLVVDDLKYLFRRNTKESVKHEWTSVEITDNIKELTFTEIEQSVYESFHQQHVLAKQLNVNPEYIINNLLKICCGGQLLKSAKHCVTLEEVKSHLLNENTQTLNSLEAECCSLEKNIKDWKVWYNNPDTSVHVQQQIQSELNKMEKRKVKLDVQQEIMKRAIGYLQLVTQNMENQTEWECGICLNDHTEIQFIGLTKCGHRFCSSCLHTTLKITNQSCPTCKTVIQESDTFTIKNISYNNDNATCNQPQELIDLIEQTKSTKIGNIVYYIKHQMKTSDKCIVFSQWDSILETVKTELIANGIQTCQCSGTIYQKKKAIDSFISPDSNVNVIMLSSTNAASGLNLVAANKIIFVEPVYGTQTHKREIESQAIARADRIGQSKPIEIIRFLINNTIEQQIHNGTEITFL